MSGSNDHAIGKSIFGPGDSGLNSIQSIEITVLFQKDNSGKDFGRHIPRQPF